MRRLRRVRIRRAWRSGESRAFDPRAVRNNVGRTDFEFAADLSPGDRLDAGRTACALKNVGVRFAGCAYRWQG